MMTKIRILNLVPVVVVLAFSVGTAIASGPEKPLVVEFEELCADEKSATHALMCEAVAGRAKLAAEIQYIEIVTMPPFRAWTWRQVAHNQEDIRVAKQCVEYYRSLGDAERVRACQRDSDEAFRENLRLVTNLDARDQELRGKKFLLEQARVVANVCACPP